MTCPPVPPSLRRVMKDAGDQLSQLERVEDMAIVASWLAGSIAAQAGADLQGMMDEVRDVYHSTRMEMTRHMRTPETIQQLHDSERAKNHERN